MTNDHPVVELSTCRADAESDLAPSPLNSLPSLCDASPSSNAVLLIVDDLEVRGLLRFGLRQQGFALREASTGTEGIEFAGTTRIGSVLLDMDVDDPDGLEVIKKLRELTQIPILALAGRVNRVGAVDALNHGANDFISRPLDIEELSARLRAAGRYGPPPPPEIFRSGSLIVDLTRRIVKVGEKIVSLTATEYSLLRLFIRHAGMVLTHTQILREVWGSEMVNKVNYLRVYLLALRRKLENSSEPELLLTERSVGYRLVIREP
jgi:two-component system KDP operon response regulator KdpE